MNSATNQQQSSRRATAPAGLALLGLALVRESLLLRPART
jgi:hypothetical protein